MIQVEEFTVLQKQLILIGMNKCHEEYGTFECNDCYRQKLLCDVCKSLDEDDEAYWKRTCECTHLVGGTENIRFITGGADEFGYELSKLYRDDYAPSWYEVPNKYDDIAVLTYNYTYGFKQCSNGHSIPQWLATYGVNLERAHCYAS